MEKRYTLSKHVKRLDRDGHTALFNGLTLKKVFGKTETIDSAIKSIEDSHSLGTNEITDSLIEVGFFVGPEQDEIIFDSLGERVGDINIANIVMIVDNRCNYACTYCQIEENMDQDQKAHSMPIDVAKTALDLFERNSAKASKRTVNLTGGEPLMNMEAVRYIIDRSREMPNTRTVMFTNGSFVTQELAEYFAKEGTLMLVSLDGPQDIHDSVRIKKGGQGTFEDSLRGYKLLRDAGCKTGISSVTGTHNVERMREVSDFFAELNPPSIGLNFGHYLLGKENPTEIPMTEFAELLTAFYSEMREKGIFVENISRFITPFYLEHPKLNECQAQGRGFTVDSRGKIGVCKSLLVSDIISKELSEVPEDLSTEPAFQEWAHRSPFTLEECIDCGVISVCGGGCTYDAFAINDGDITKIDPRLCEYTNNVVEFLVWDLFEDIKDKIGNGVYIPNIAEQEQKFVRYYDPTNQLQRSVGHETERRRKKNA